MKPSYTVIAGSNGAGKSTFFDNVTKIDVITGVFVNTDQIAVDLSAIHNASERSIDFQAGRETLKLMRKFFHQQVDVTRETTLSGRESLNSLTHARNAGYKTALVYIGLDSVELAIERVCDRVRKGGHDIPEEAIRRRYTRSLRNAADAWKIADKFYFIDNTTAQGYIPILMKDAGRKLWLSESRPGWLQKIVEHIESNS